MTQHPPVPVGRLQAPGTARLSSGPPSGHPGAGQPGGICIEQITALVELASGADTAAIEGLEAIVANLRLARDARDELAATVPPELLRQVLIARSTGWEAEPLGHDGQPGPDAAPVRPEGQAR